MSAKSVIVVGDALLDRDIEGTVTRVAPDAPVPVLDQHSEISRPGGAGLAAVLASRRGADVALVTALGEDAAGDVIAEYMKAEGVALLRLNCSVRTPEKIRLRNERQTLLRLDRGHPPKDPTVISMHERDRILDLIASAGAVLVADYGRGLARSRTLRRMLSEKPERVVWDPHPRGARPIPGASLVTPSIQEVSGSNPETPLGYLVARAENLRRQWRVSGLSVTLGARGACYVSGTGVPLMVPARSVTASDVCGAGDCFAAQAALALSEGALPSEAVVSAVEAATSFVELGGAAALATAACPRSQADASTDPLEMVNRVRNEGGKIVATSGCFDLLHAGHLHSLQAARALGDCLVVCLNSDQSVRALKGSGRPVVSQSDRAAALEALACVDAIVIFDEPTPTKVLRALRPAIFAKGDDYRGANLAEQEVLDAWGGQCVTLPYLAGYSTSRFVEEALAK